MSFSPTRRSAAEATLGAFDPPMRDLLVPLLMYKSVFLGEWFVALASHERDVDVREALGSIHRDTLREAIELVEAARAWGDLPLDAGSLEAVVPVLQRRILQDLLELKEGSTEAVLYAAMRAPTDELRRLLVSLADRDRAHGDVLRALLGTAGAAARREGPESPGVREQRAGEGTLSRSIRKDIDGVRQAGHEPVRLVLSAITLRHLRDEQQVSPDGTAFDLPADVDFGWRGESYAIETSERVRLAELLSTQDP